MAGILIVEDEVAISTLISDFLVSRGHECQVLADGSCVVETVRNSSLDLVVLDLMLPVKDGIQIIREIREFSSLPIIMLTARDSEVDVILGLELGADDYMTKPFSPRELETRIRTVLRRSKSGSLEENRRDEADSTIRIAGCVRMDLASRTVHCRETPVDLTTAQFDMLRVMLESPGTVFTRASLLEKTSGYAYEGYERTVDVQIKNIRKVLESDPANPSIILTVWGVGYKFSCGDGLQ